MFGAVVMFLVQICIVVFFLHLVWRFVCAHERIADSIEGLQRRVTDLVKSKEEPG